MNKKRASMRPVTLKRIIEVCNLALRHPIVNEKLIMQELKTSMARAKELLFEMERMKLIKKHVKGFSANKNTIMFVEAFENEDWKAFHEYFMRNYSFYRQFINLLRVHINEERGLLISEMKKEAKIKQLQLNQTIIEVLQNWGERLGVLQRHLYTKRFYLLEEETPGLDEFKDVVQSSYQFLNTVRGLGLKLTYVEIPRLREEVCEKMKIARETFDILFRRLYRESIGIIELSGAPTITVAKKSPISIRKIKASKKDNILAPYLDLAKERKGLEISGKTYYYVALHQKVK